MMLFTGCAGQGAGGTADTDTATPAQAAPEELTFSLDSAFVEQGAELELAPVVPGADIQIRYTLDGSAPTAESALYEAPIVLDSGEGRGCWTVKAALQKGSRLGTVHTRSYFPADTAVYGDEMVAVSITGEPDDFYSNERGILALGAEDEAAALADEDLPLNFRGDKRANYYGRSIEWERPVTVEVYDAAGQKLLQQGAGIRVTGGATRDFPQKSLRLYARREYDVSGSFPAGMFGQLYSGEGDGPALEKFNHFDLRNGGDDWAFTMLADATMRTLAAQAGLEPVGLARPAVVYLNGAYYGLAWMQPDYHEKNIAWSLGLEHQSQVEELEAFALPMAEGIVQNEELPGSVKEYEQMYQLALGDLTVQKNAEALEKKVDMDNFFLYYALEMWCNNEDWPHNNYKVWRYARGTAGEKNSTGMADGRWRFLLYDSDCAYGTYADPTEGFEWTLGQGRSPMLGSVLRNNDFRARFVNTWCILMATALHPDNARSVIYGAKDAIEAEMVWREQNDPVTFDANLRQVMYIKIDDFLQRRPAEVAQGLATYCGAETPYTLSVACPEGATVSINALELAEGSTLEGTFYTEAPFTLTAQVAEGRTFAGWQVGGEVVTEEALTVAGPAPGADAVRIELLLD